MTLSARPGRSIRNRHLRLVCFWFLLAGGRSAAAPGSLAGTDYTPQYDFSQDLPGGFRGQSVRSAGAAGIPSPLAAVMQANRPRPGLTFAYEVPAELPRPDYRLVLVFDPAIDLTAMRVCAE